MPTAQAEPLKIVIDFDSTFTKVEGLDELARIALQGNPKQAEIVGKIKDEEIENRLMDRIDAELAKVGA